MLFNSLHFVLYYPVVTAVFFLLAPRRRWVWLLLASAYFYGVFRPSYLLILALVIAVDYVSGLLIEGSTGHRRRLYLALSLGCNLTLLAVFKYFDFIATNLTGLAGLVGSSYRFPLLDMVLPIGLSFHTFQSMSYTIEVYRGAQRAERHLGIFAVYVLFYPQLVAGPIERPQNILPQLHAEQRFEPGAFVSGLRLALWGLVKKVVVSDRLGSVVDTVYNAPHDHGSLALVAATYLFAFQIYCDFSGYSDVARGVARTMGFDLMVNFRRPYFAQSIPDFWRRWHISLSTWFRDYVYIPLGGNRVSRARQIANTAVVFLVSGLWHGANWTFVVWGALHAVFSAVSLLRGRRPAASSSLAAFGRMVVTFHLVTLAWVFFRARTVGDAFYILSHAAGRPSLAALAPLGGLGKLAASAALIAGVLVIDAWNEWGTLTASFERRPRWVRWAIYYAVTLLVVFGGAPSSGQFIYFQF